MADFLQAFDYCSNPLGPLRQNLFSCLTCNPPPDSPLEPYNPAGVCYSCSIACHGEHTLVELFGRRNFTCDCGTSRMPPASPCTLRINPETGIKGPVHSQIPATANTYNKNFQNRFCGCGEIHNPYEEKGTMFQCLGLSNEQDGGCGEDWWHPECVLGLGRDWLEGTQLKTAQSDPPDDANVEENEEPVHPLPHGFPQEDEFESFICYKCVDANPWIKRYAGSSGFLMPVFRKMLPLPAEQPQQPGSMRLSDESAMDEKRQGENGRTSPASALSSPVKIFADAQVLDDTGNRALQTNTGWMDRQTANIEKASTPESSTNAPTISKKRKAEDVPEDSSCPKRPKDDTPPPAINPSPLLRTAPSPYFFKKISGIISAAVPPAIWCCGNTPNSSKKKLFMSPLCLRTVKKVAAAKVLQREVCSIGARRL